MQGKDHQRVVGMNRYYHRFTFWMATLIIACPTWAWAGPKITLGKRTALNQQVTTDQIDHAVWDMLLRKYVDSLGQVNYQAWKDTPADRQALDNYLRGLSRANLQAPASRNGRLAFWINAYNAVTIRGILREYPTTSIRNHTAKVFGYNLWKDLLLTVGVHAYSLEAMEHQILRKMGEPRIHFAIVCASQSCPRLLPEAYLREKLEQQLASNTHLFFANKKNFRYDAAGNRFYLSKILSWFGEDFGKDQAAQLKSIAPYLPSQEATDLANANSVAITYLDYNWNLNEQK